MKFCSIAAVALCTAGLSAQADDIATKGRAIFEKHRGAVVTVQLVIKQQFSMPGMGSQDNESKAEANGTVIDPTGLTVVSLSETDPTSIMESMMAGTPGLGDFKMDTEVRDVKILLPDGTELPAEIILRDKELDLAFVRPVQKPGEALSFIEMSAPGKPELMDQVISLSRLGTVAGRVHAASVERIDAIVEKPRTFYIPGKDPTNTNLGSPAFTIDGAPIGVFLLRAIKDTSGGGGGLFGGNTSNITTVLLPAEDILEAAQQAPAYSE